MSGGEGADLARFGVFACALLLPMSAAMFVFPAQIDLLKAVGVPFFLTEVATAVWLLAGRRKPRLSGRTRV